jgi:Chaperone of endosialidase
MPRDGSFVYAIPPGTEGIPDTTIASAKYNGFAHDVETDLNTPRPVLAGGTGANNALAARDNLDAEVAAQNVVNYDSHVWENGSFRSVNDTPGAPAAGTAFAGICYKFDNNYIVLEARNVSVADGKSYVRQKVSNVWGAWIQASESLTGMDGRYVNVTGDTMTGTLNITGTTSTINVIGGTPQLQMNKTASGQSTAINAFTNNLSRWQVNVGDTAAESGSNAGSNFTVYRFSDAGTVIDSPFSIARATGAVTMTGDLTVTKTFPVINLNKSASGDRARIVGQKGGLQRWVLEIGDTATESGSNVGSDFYIYRYTDAGAFIDAPLTIARSTGQITIPKLSAPNYVAKTGDTMTGLLTVPTFVSTGAAKAGQLMQVSASGNPSVTAYNTNTVNEWGFWVGSTRMDLGIFNAGGGVPTGTGCWLSTAAFTVLVATSAKPGGGSWADSSDARIKNVLGDYTHGLAEIMQVRPVRYTFKGNYSADKIAGTKDAAHANVLDKEFVGVVAQEIEVPMPETVTQVPGYIDNQPVNDARIYDASALIYALVNSVKELAARLDALEVLAKKIEAL